MELISISSVHVVMYIVIVAVIAISVLKFAVTIVKMLGILVLFTALGSGLVYTPIIRSILHVLLGTNP